MKRAWGIDFSRRSHTSYTYQSHHDFVIVGVSDGNYQLPSVNKFLAEASRAPVTGAYHYLRSSRPLDEQVETYLKAVKNFDLDFHVVDYERINNQNTKAFAMMPKAFCKAVKAETGKKVLIYTSPSVVAEYMYPHDVYYIREDWVNLWVAQYPYKTWHWRLKHVPTSESWQPYLPTGVKDWKFWQYSADFNGQAKHHGVRGNNDIDLDVFNGTKAELISWAKEDQPDQPAPPAPPQPQPDEKEIYNQAIKDAKQAVGALRKDV